jgi:hypothetical protein
MTIEAGRTTVDSGRSSMPARKTKPKRGKAKAWGPIDPMLYGKWAAWVPGTDQLIDWAESYEDLHEKTRARGLLIGQYAVELVEGPQAGYDAPPIEEA